MRSPPRAVTIAILAMGGEGGGVLADWLVDLAERNGFIAQATSVPGVAQRTGATIYYVELFPRSADGRRPVLALMPLPGDVDVVLASELMEAGRAVQRGLVTPDRTTLIASTHRVYSIAEKAAMADGRVDADNLLAHAKGAARRFIGFDMARAAEEAGSVISAVLFGALAGTGVLPFSRAQFEATIERGGVGVKWVKTMKRTYDVAGMVEALKDALTTREPGPKVLVAQSECMLNRQRREKPLWRKAEAEGRRVVRERFGVDADTCTGDHSCIRLSGCPSLSIKPNPDPLRTDPVATVLDSCVGCGLCGEVSHAAVLCPSFYKARIVSNPTRLERAKQRVRDALIGALQRRDERRRQRHAF
jgi:Pyruvate/2-oxoacid:ferredoxin oxidoreductase gamma subunit/NAD-dependent dihydropyrimidine dehydrogenase PreA subunit